MDVGEIDTIEPIPNDVLLINMMSFCFLFPNGLILKNKCNHPKNRNLAFCSFLSKEVVLLT